MSLDNIIGFIVLFFLVLLIPSLIFIGVAYTLFMLLNPVGFYETVICLLISMLIGIGGIFGYFLFLYAVAEVFG